MLSVSSQFSIDLYELIRSKTDEATAKKAVESVEGIIEAKNSALATNESLLKMENRLMNRLMTVFVTLVVMILGLYGVLFFK